MELRFTPCPIAFPGLICPPILVKSESASREHPLIFDLASVVVSVYVTSHRFILPICGPSAATLVPPDPDY